MLITISLLILAYLIMGKDITPLLECVKLRLKIHSTSGSVLSMNW